jgi:hypothetical protein
MLFEDEKGKARVRENDIGCCRVLDKRRKQIIAISKRYRN